jgi:hypothetical protein
MTEKDVIQESNTEKTPEEIFLEDLQMEQREQG